MLAQVACLTLAAVQQPQLQVHPDDPLHQFADLEVGREGATVEYVADFSGSLSMWASSESLDPRLVVEVSGREGLFEDDDSGGGTTAWLSIDVEPGDALAIVVAADSTPAAVELHVVAAREKEETRAAADQAAAELAEIDRLKGEGALQDARARVERLVERLVATVGTPESRLVSLALWRAGSAAYQLAAIEPADHAWAEAHAALERLLPPDHPDLIAAKVNLAVARQALGDLAGAHSLFEAVHAARERLLPPDHPEILLAKSNLAVTRRQLGDLQGALALEEAVHAAWERLLPPDHPHLLLAKGNLAATRRALGDLAGALALAREVAAALASVGARAATAAPREARATGGDAVQRLARVRFWSEAAGAELAEPTFTVLETVRQAVSSPLMARLAAIEGAEASAIRAHLRAAEQELDRLVSSGPELPEDGALGGADPSQAREEARRAWREAIQGAALRRDRAQRELLALVEDGFVVRVTADGVGRALGATEIAAGITKLDRWRWHEERNYTVNDGPHYLAQVMLPGGELREVDLGAASALEDRIDAWRAKLGSPLEREDPAASARGGVDKPNPRGVGVVAGPKPNEVEAGRALRRALVDPILEAAGDPDPGTTLHLCLDDALFTVPVDALPLDEPAEGANAELLAEHVPGDVVRLGDRYRVRHELSFARLLRPRADPDGPPSVLAVGDVDFETRVAGDLLHDAAPLYRLSAWGRWDRLSATGAEVSELVYQAKEHLGVDARVLLRDQVTQAALAEAARGARYVHLATHGWFLPRTERKSILDDEHGGADGALELAGDLRMRADGAGPLLGSRATVTGFAPETLCGLVLSGANAGDTDAERSASLLTAQELAGFDLSGCDLAVLSACETNVGIRRAGQGIQSLQSALHMAGARTSITSLWAVQDWPTQSLMKRFYDNLWEKGMSKADALWEAKRTLRAEGQPPFVWAGWVLFGDPD